MADQKLTALSATSSIVGTDLLYTVVSPAATPVSYKITGENASNALFALQAIGGAASPDGYGPLHGLKALDQSGWSWVNQGGAAVTQSGGVVLLEGPAQAGRNTRMRVVSAPSTPYTITALVIPVTFTSANFSWAGLCWRESGTGKIIEHYRLMSGAIESVKDTNETTFSATFGSSLALGISNFVPIWLRLTDDGTNLITSFSFDSVNFIQVNSEGRTVFMAGGPDQVGIAVACQAGGIQKMSVLSWEQT